MLPKQILYVIESYKYQASLAYFLIILGLMFPLIIALQNSNNSRQLISGQVDYSGVVSHTIVDPNRKSTPKPGTSAVALPYTSVNTSWPMQGKVTTEFGVPHRPWQRTHTGIDITSAARAGTTAVKAFKEGTVSAVTRSNSGLGNHLVIDHGNGLKSLYAHLSYFSAREGQHVYASEPIGFEGRSGATTGTHLHFEILINDKPVNPRNYIIGSP